ncbi:MAG: hypothetical protein VYE73_03110, partial [Acidobacteriota bacterium]|nr:hypothetical protein [Acidobacteriota bacterium]
AIASAPKTTANEQAYVGALADRNGAEALEDRSQKLDGVVIWGLNAPETILAVATEVLAGEIASARGDHDSAVAYLRRAVELETAVVYDEPPTWNVPVRQILGAVLLAADLPSEAELSTELAKARKEADVEIDASRF